MTKALHKAFEVASKLPELEQLAEEALQEYRAGRTKPLDPDEL